MSAGHAPRLRKLKAELCSHHREGGWAWPPPLQGQVDHSQGRHAPLGAALGLRACVRRPRAWAHRGGRLCSYSRPRRGRRRGRYVSRAVWFLSRAVSFCTFLSQGFLRQGTISAISYLCDGFQALLPVLLIKPNKADCSRWLRGGRSRYRYQRTKKPFIKVLSDPRLCIYQSLPTNSTGPGPSASGASSAPARSCTRGSVASSGTGNAARVGAGHAGDRAQRARNVCCFGNWGILMRTQQCPA